MPRGENTNPRAMSVTIHAHIEIDPGEMRLQSLPSREVGWGRGWERRESWREKERERMREKTERVPPKQKIEKRAREREGSRYCEKKCIVMENRGRCRGR